jgi:hypothetical protein
VSKWNKRSGGGRAGRWNGHAGHGAVQTPANWSGKLVGHWETREKWVPSTVGPGIQQRQPAERRKSRAGGVEAEMRERERREQ